MLLISGIFSRGKEKKGATKGGGSCAIIKTTKGGWRYKITAVTSCEQ